MLAEFMRKVTTNRRLQPWVNVGAVVVLVLTLTITGNVGRIRAGDVNVLANGGFEDGFTAQAGCGTVGAGWNCFTNGGRAHYSFYDDQWGPVVANGSHSQLIEMNTQGVLDADPDRYAGIYQTVPVVEGSQYTFSLKGMMRTTEMEGDPWRYRVQVGWTQGQDADWTQVTNWTDVGWDTYYARTSPGAFSQFSTKLQAEAGYVTVYIRVWKKWGVPEMELDVNLDAISLTGPAPGGTPTPTSTATPAPGQTPTVVVACGGVNRVANGTFEDGFNPVAIGHVGKSWGWFTNGGATVYGFYDDQWPPVVGDGAHSQLIELNTKGMAAADPDRYAGIYQKISGLTTGATYQLTVRGLLRGVNGGPDPNRFEAQWGYNRGTDTDWSHVANWQSVNLGPIYERTAPGAIATYTVKFQAPASEMVLFLRGWKKWGTAATEMDLNLDSIALNGCSSETTTAPPGQCTYVVQPGDTLAAIAYRFGVGLYALAAANNIANVNIIYVGQVLYIPGCSAPAPTPMPTATPSPAPMTYTVQPGDTLSSIAVRFGVDLYYLAQINGIVDIDYIYVGQVLVIP